MGFNSGFKVLNDNVVLYLLILITFTRNRFLVFSNGP